MGLDATVFCDCFEKGRLRESPPAGCEPVVAADGSLDCNSKQTDVIVAFDEWHRFRACGREYGALVHHYIGNVALVADLRRELQRHAESFPLILSLVIYNGIHAGDFISVERLGDLGSEVDKLAYLHSDDPEMEIFLRKFESQMYELVKTARALGKPIAF